MSQHVFRIVGLIILCLMAAGCGLISLREERAVIESLPAYPGAVRTGDFTTTWPDSHPSAGIVYSVDAEPERILAFYKSRLSQEGWKVEATQEPSGLDEQGSLLLRRDIFWCRISIRGRARPYDTSVRISKGRL